MLLHMRSVGRISRPVVRPSGGMRLTMVESLNPDSLRGTNPRGYPVAPMNVPLGPMRLMASTHECAAAWLRRVASAKKPREDCVNMMLWVMVVA